MNRLDTVAPDAAARLKAAKPAQRRAAALAAARFAVTKSKVADPDVDRALSALDETGKLTAKAQQSLEALATKLDDEYLELHGQESASAATRKKALKLFGQARAVSALTYASEAGTFSSAADCVYEAAMSTDDRELVLRAAMVALHGGA